MTDESAQPLVGVNVHLSGSAIADTTTDATGTYTFTGLPQGGNFTVTPSLTNYSFTPPSRTVSNLQSDQTGLDFTGKFLIYVLSGRVTDEGAQPLVGINVHLSGSADRDTTTDAAGNYSFVGLTQGQLHHHAHRDKLPLHPAEPHGQQPAKRPDRPGLHGHGHHLHASRAGLLTGAARGCPASTSRSRARARPWR